MNIIENTEMQEMGDLAKEDAKFLDRDFNQCFQQLRHYDLQSLDICKFCFSAYSALIGLSLGLFNYGAGKSVDYSVAASGACGVGLLFGLIFLSLVVRNRVYFVAMARYINEHRGFFLQRRPLGFANHSKMYTDMDQPPYYHWRSSHSLIIYILSVLNSFLAFGAFLFFNWRWGQSWNLALIIGFAAALLQIGFSVLVLMSKQRKSVTKAVFGNP